MKVEQLLNALQHIFDTEGDLEVTISVCGNNGASVVANFIELDEYSDGEKMVSIREYPY